jgi:hypothetical protein
MLGKKVNGTREDLQEDQQPELDWEDPTRYGMSSSPLVADLVIDCCVVRTLFVKN